MDFQQAISEQVAEMRRALAASQQEIVRAHQKVSALEVKVQSPDRRMTLTLNGTGDATALEFHDDTYLEMNARQLGHAIIQLLRSGQTKVRTSVAGMLPSAPFTGLSMSDLLDPQADITSLIPQDLLESLLGSDFEKDRRNG